MYIPVALKEDYRCNFIVSCIDSDVSLDYTNGWAGKEIKFDYKFFKSNTVYDCEKWSFEDFMILSSYTRDYCKKNKIYHMAVLIAEFEEYYIINYVGYQTDMMLVYKNKKENKNITIKDILILNAEVVETEDKIIFTGKYTDFHQIYLDNKEKYNKNIETYKKYRAKYKIFGGSYRMLELYGNLHAILDNKGSETETKIIKFNDRIQTIDIDSNSYFNSNIEEIVLPAFFKKIRCNTHTINKKIIGLPNLKKITFNKGIKILYRNSLPVKINSDISIQFPKTLEYIDTQIIETIKNIRSVIIYQDTIENMKKIDNKGYTDLISLSNLSIIKYQ